MPCGHPRGCLVQDEEGTAHCAWCEEVAWLRGKLEQATALEAELKVAANALVQRLAAVNLQAANATAFGNAMAYGPEVMALQAALGSTAAGTVTIS